MIARRSGDAGASSTLPKADLDPAGSAAAARSTSSRPARASSLVHSTAIG